MRRKGSRNVYFQQRIPADVRPLTVGGLKLALPIGEEFRTVTLFPDKEALKLSLGTGDPAEAKIRNAKLAAYLEDAWRKLRSGGGPVTLTGKQAHALAGELYRAWANGEGRERTKGLVRVPVDDDRKEGEPAKEWIWVDEDDAMDGEPEVWAKASEFLAKAAARDAEKVFGPIIDHLLPRKGIVAGVTPATRELLLDAFHLAMKQAFEARGRNAEGDFRPDPNAARFPAFESPATPQKASQSKTSLSELLEAWWAEAKSAGRKPSTYESYKHTTKALVAFLGHDDAKRVTSDDIVGFKDHRLSSVIPRTGKPISAKTVKDGDLAGLKTVFGWAVANRKLTTNPATGITIKLGKPPKLRSKGFTEEEAKALLSAALRFTRGREAARTFAAKKWVPWLQAYSGARVGELAQLRKQDVRREDGHWIIELTPEAGTIKTNEARKVVLHPHLVELGFPAFVKSAPAGHLFLNMGKAGNVLGPLHGLKNRLVESARGIVTDKNVAPNHGWRHRFKTIGREAGIPPRILDAIQGHAPRTDGDSYGDVTVKAMAMAMKRVPRVVVDKAKE